MVFSYYLYKYPYKILWHLRNKIKANKELAFYCADPLDYEMFVPILKYLPDVKIIAKNSKTRNYLTKKNIKYFNMPYFPKIVIMARHMHYKFPVNEIVKIGFDHGLYQFKKWTSSKNYNGFNTYFVSSEDQVKKARERGIISTVAIGYPKLDNAFNGTYNENYLDKLKTSINLDKNKKTIIFTSTWNVDGLSALSRWVDHVGSLTSKYNILLTAHTWTDKKLLTKLKNIDNTIFLKDFDITPYLMIADVFVGDYNSMIGEFCAFDKPIITFTVPESERTIPEVRALIKRISIQVDTFEELHSAIETSLKNPLQKSSERKTANKILFYALDGKAGERAANIILEHIKKT